MFAMQNIKQRSSPKDKDDDDDEVARFLGDEEASRTATSIAPNRPRRPGSWRFRIILLAGVILVVSSTTVLFSWILRFTSPAPESQTLHILLYGARNKTNTLDLCRTVLTSASLNYASARLVNSSYHMDDDEDEIVYRRHKRDVVPVEIEEDVEPQIVPLGHIVEDFDEYISSRSEATRNMLNSLEPSQDDDLIVITDAYDTFFQLHPSILMDRYHRLNTKASRREGFMQSIIIAAGKHCTAKNSTAPWCYIQPEASPQSLNYKGAGLKYDPGFESPKFLDGGFIMGPIKDIRKLMYTIQEYEPQDFARKFARKFAMHRYGRKDWDLEKDFDTALNQVFAEQQLWREMSRGGHPGLSHRVRDTVAKITHSVPRKTLPERTRLGLLPGRNYEFHVGLDYESELVQVHSVESYADTRFLRFNGEQKKIAPGAASCKSRVGKLPSDIERSGLPFENLQSKHVDVAVAKTPWSAVRLYTNICSGSVPAVIIRREDTKEPNVDAPHDAIWQQLWMREQAKQLLETQRWRADHARAKAVGGSMILGADSTVEDFDPRIDVLSSDVNVGDLTPEYGDGIMSWKNICGPLEEAIFA